MNTLLANASLDRAESLYRSGMVSESELETYLRQWNAGPHFTQAVLIDGSIRNFDPDKWGYPSAVEARFGVRR